MSDPIMELIDRIEALEAAGKRLAEAASKGSWIREAISAWRAVEKGGGDE